VTVEWKFTGTDKLTEALFDHPFALLSPPSLLLPLYVQILVLVVVVVGLLM
jgi:hypothetical protein